MIRLLILIQILFILLPAELLSQEQFAPLSDSLQGELKKAKDARGKILMLTEWADHARQVNAPDAKQILQVAIPFAQQHHLDSQLITLWMIKGMVYDKLFEKDSTRIIYRGAITQAMEVGDTARLAKLFKLYARSLDAVTDKDSAIWYRKEALKVARGYEDVSEEFSILNDLGLTFMHNAEYEEGEKYFLEAVEIQQQIGNKRYLAGMFHNLGNNASGANDQDKAIGYYQEALQMVIELEDDYGQILMLSLIAYHYMQKGYIPLSLEHYQQALDISNKMTEVDPGMKIQCLRGIAEVHESMDNYEKALPFYLDILFIIDQSNNPEGFPEVLNDIGENYRFREQYDTAIVYFNRALEYPNVKHAVSFTHIGYSYEGMDQLDSAYTYLQKGLGYARETKAFSVQTVCLTSLGRVLNRQGNWLQALQYLEEAEQIARREGSRENQMEAAALLYQISKEQNNLPQALYYHETYKNLEDSLYNVKNTERLVRLQADAEFKQEKQRISYEQERENEKQSSIRRIMILALGAAILLILIFAWYYRQKKQANDQLTELNVEISSQKAVVEAQKEKLEELDHFKQDMTGMIVHDLKNPLNTIIGLSEGNANPPYSRTIRQAGNSMLSMVMNILDVQKFEEAQMSLHLDKIDLRSLINQAVDRVAMLIEEKSLQINVNVSSELPLSVDQELIIRTFENLLTNSIKFTPVGKQITLYQEEELQDAFVKIWIEDEGPGISADQAKHIFAKYGQDRKRSSGRARSTGLGLTFCQLAVEAHGGAIEVVTRENNGAQFWLTLPLFDRNEKNQPISIQETPYQQKEPENQEGSLILSEEEQALFLPLLEEMKQLQIFQISQIRKLLKELPEDPDSPFVPWKQAMEQALFNQNEIKYQLLLTLTLAT